MTTPALPNVRTIDPDELMSIMAAALAETSHLPKVTQARHLAITLEQAGYRFIEKSAMDAFYEWGRARLTELDAMRVGVRPWMGGTPGA